MSDTKVSIPNKRRVSEELRPGTQETDLSAFQKRIGRFAVSAFGPTPPEVHAARLAAETVDVLDCAAIGDEARMGAALAGVLVVALALAESRNIDLTAALIAEQDLNESSEWRKTSWGQWHRVGDGSVPEDEVTAQIVAAVTAGLSPTTAGMLLRERGASLPKVIEYLRAALGLSEEAFHAPRKEGFAPTDRGVDVIYRPFFGTLKAPKTVTGAAEGLL